MGRRTSALLSLVVCGLACRGPDVLGTTSTADDTTSTTDSTSEAATDPTGGEKFDIPPPTPPPPLACGDSPAIPDGALCSGRLLDWPWDSVGAGWYEFLYACTDDAPDVCPAPDSLKVESRLLQCHACDARKLLPPVCGPDPARADACCYWALAEARPCE